MKERLETTSEWNICLKNIKVKAKSKKKCPYLNIYLRIVQVRTEGLASAKNGIKYEAKIPIRRT